MAELTLKDGEKQFVDYNTAAKVWQIQQGNILPKEDPAELKRLKELAAKTSSIDFKKMERG